jgi:LuxR family transcriptional regulator, quorum-sensing system regulator CinR
VGVAMATGLPDEERLSKAYSIIETAPEMEEVIEKLRDVLNVDHVVYNLARPPAGHYIQLTYPPSWVKRYINMGYADVDPISREGSQRTLPFNWNELTIQSAAEASFLTDAISHGIGPHGFSIPLLTKNGRHRALFSISFSRSEQEWTNFLATTRSVLIQIANRLHRRVIVEAFGEDLV